ncbi:MAG TPA: hypothetical protein PKA58_05480 [Polyangium sp.]|jgi:hypothetical protein|nr:hypothetical protein [Polyangium sp.]
MAHKEAIGISTEEPLDMADATMPVPDGARSDEEWVAVVERRARRALAGEPGISWADARKDLERRFGSF